MEDAFHPHWMVVNETHFQFPNMIDGGLFKQRAPLTNIDCSVVLPHHMLQRLGSHDLRLNNRLHNWWVVSLVQFDSLAFSAYVSFPGFSCWGKWSCNVLTQALLRTSAGRGLRTLRLRTSCSVNGISIFQIRCFNSSIWESFVWFSSF